MTPRTDALEHDFYGVPDHSDDLDYHAFLRKMTHHARQLERELASTQRMLADCYEAQRIGTQYAAPQERGDQPGLGVEVRTPATALEGPFDSRSPEQRGVEPTPTSAPAVAARLSDPDLCPKCGLLIRGPDVQGDVCPGHYKPKVDKPEISPNGVPYRDMWAGGRGPKK